jgi:hypothetical protein
MCSGFEITMLQQGSKPKAIALISKVCTSPNWCIKERAHLNIKKNVCEREKKKDQLEKLQKETGSAVR